MHHKSIVHEDSMKSGVIQHILRKKRTHQSLYHKTYQTTLENVVIKNSNTYAVVKRPVEISN